MSKIKTREKSKDIKVLDKSAMIGQRMKSSFLRSKRNAEALMDDRQATPNEYAADKTELAADDLAHDAVNVAASGAKTAVRQGRKLFQRQREKWAAEKRQENTAPAEQSHAPGPAQGIAPDAHTPQRNGGTAPERQRLPHHKHMAEHPSAQAARVTAKATATTAKAAAKGVSAAAKALLASIKALVTAIAAGGWVAILAIVVICLIGLIAASPFGIFFSGEDSGTGQTMPTVVREINLEYESKLGEIESSTAHDRLELSGSRAVWPEVLAVYAVKTTTDPDNPQEVATMDDGKKELLKEIFWAMNEISHRTETATTTQTVETDDGKGNIIVEEVEVTATTLYITVTHKTTDEMADIYNFTADQREMLAELLAEESNGMWSAVLYGIGTGDGEIVTVALSQLGNVGGQPYWSWYGFESRVDWCACFVSWCANECGYLDAGVIPKFASCSIGIQWFRERGLWQDRSYEPRPGDLIFFDWDDEDEGQDGAADHVGIVEKVEGGIVYTVEGNSGNACRERQYAIGHTEIYGYGTPAY